MYKLNNMTSNFDPAHYRRKMIISGKFHELLSRRKKRKTGDHTKRSDLSR